MKKILLIPSLLTIGLAPMVSMVSCNDGVKPKDITLNKTTLNLEVGKTAKLTATVEPAEASQEVEWSSSNPDVCTVDNGEVKAISVGKANITVKPKGYEIPAVCIVNVEPEPEYTEISLTKHDGRFRSAKLDLNAGQSYKFVIDSIGWADDNFLFSDEFFGQDYDVNVTVRKILVNGNESTDYEINTDDCWCITSWHHDAGIAEIYLTAKGTTNDVYAWVGG